MEKSDNSQTGPQISVVVPFYNEEANVEELYRRLKKVLDKLKRTYELIFIDDGSTDKTPEILQKIYEKDELVKIIRLRKNFGQNLCLLAS